jgi:hypothetical protein
MTKPRDGYVVLLEAFVRGLESNLLTQAQYADHRRARGLRGASRAAVHKAIKSGRISIRNGRLDRVVADAEWARNTREVQWRSATVQAVPAPVARRRWWRQAWGRIGGYVSGFLRRARSR